MGDISKEAQKIYNHKKHPNDWAIFNRAKIVIIRKKDSELFIIDKVKIGFGNAEYEIDLSLVEKNGFEIVGEL